MTSSQDDLANMTTVGFCALGKMGASRNNLRSQPLRSRQAGHRPGTTGLLRLHNMHAGNMPVLTPALLECTIHSRRRQVFAEIPQGRYQDLVL